MSVSYKFTQDSFQLEKINRGYWWHSHRWGGDETIGGWCLQGNE